MRTISQHQWALVSEKVVDKWGQNIKYSMGKESILATLKVLSIICEKAGAYRVPLTESAMLFLRDKIFDLIKFMEQE